MKKPVPSFVIGVIVMGLAAFALQAEAQVRPPAATQPPIVAGQPPPVAGQPPAAGQPPTTVPQPPAVSQPAPAPTPAAKQQGPWAEDYRVGPGDKLRVEVYKDPQLSQSVQVRPDGKITLPFVGDLVAADLTPLQLRDKISAALKEYVTNPVVTVIVVETLASNVYVMGEVAKAGPLPYQGQMTALQAIAMAGGFKDFANTKEIRILRRGPRGVETIKFNYRDAVKGGDPLYLRVGDTIIVP